MAGQTLRGFRGITRNVLFLGLVSLLTDISSEMLYPLIPLFLTTTLGAPVSIVGLMEGLAEMTASLMKGISGYWSDHLGKRKPFVFAGYSCSALAKPLLGMAAGWPMAFSARVFDRFGKGVRGTSRDAILAESTEQEHRGGAFGFHRSMDQMGAVIGPLAALPLLALFGGNVRPLFLVAFLPALAGVALVAVVRETGAGASGGQRRLMRWKETPPAFRRYLLVTLIFALGNSSDAFLILRARQLGGSTDLAVLLFAVFNAVTVLCAYPAGAISDRLGRRTVVAGGFLMFAACYAGLAAASSVIWLWPLFAFYGVYAGVAEGAARAYVVDLVDPAHKAAALGLHATVNGVLMLAASSMAGALWDRIGPTLPFLVGAATATAGAFALLVLLPAKPPQVA